ncbi:MAG: hypothetical protein DCC58_05155 [Chloroflexi bacterium]|nr:MAG: hypothetical protein DCC58_05155 [Chloroflexota bacterium]
MHARIIRTQIRGGKVEEAIQLFRSDVLPAAGEQPELGTIALLADRTTGRGLTMALWESEQAMNAAQESGWTQQQLGRFASMLAAAPAIETYEVSVRERPTSDAITHARVVSVRIKPDMYDEAIALYRDAVMPAARQQPGFLGAVLLTDRATGTGLSITAWASEAALHASDASGYFQSQLQQFGAMFAAPPVVETYEVAAVRLGA